MTSAPRTLGATTSGTTTLAIAGSSAETAAVARSIGLPMASGPTTVPLVVVATTRADIDAVRTALSLHDGCIAAVAAVRLAEDQVLAALDLGVPVVFGFCSRAELDEAIARGPASEERATAATLASIEHAIGAQP